MLILRVPTWTYGWSQKLVGTGQSKCYAGIETKPWDHGVLRGSRVEVEHSDSCWETVKVCQREKRCQLRPHPIWGHTLLCTCILQSFPYMPTRRKRPQSMYESLLGSLLAVALDSESCQERCTVRNRGWHGRQKGCGAHRPLALVSKIRVREQPLGLRWSMGSRPGPRSLPRWSLRQPWLPACLSQEGQVTETDKSICQEVAEEKESLSPLSQEAQKGNCSPEQRKQQALLQGRLAWGRPLSAPCPSFHVSRPEHLWARGQPREEQGLQPTVPAPRGTCQRGQRHCLASLPVLTGTLLRASRLCQVEAQTCGGAREGFA